MSATRSADQRLLEEIRRTRIAPRPTRFDYLHLRHLRNDIATALRAVPTPVRDVLDVFCGARPYESLMPTGARVVGLDIDDAFGVADVVTEEFLPFPDGSFDLVFCTQAFYYVADPQAGADEIRRVLRPGGTAIITVPFVWEYDRTSFEHRFTGPELAGLFGEWEGVEVVENGGRAVVWATLTGSLTQAVERRVARGMLRHPLRPLFLLAYLAINAVGSAADALEPRWADSRLALSTNVLVSARSSS